MLDLWKQICKILVQSIGNERQGVNDEIKEGQDDGQDYNSNLEGKRVGDKV